MPTLQGFDLQFATDLAREAGRLQRLHFRANGIEREIKDEIDEILGDIENA